MSQSQGPPKAPKSPGEGQPRSNPAVDNNADHTHRNYRSPISPAHELKKHLPPLSPVLRFPKNVASDGPASKHGSPVLTKDVQDAELRPQMLVESVIYHTMVQSSSSDIFLGGCKPAVQVDADQAASDTSLSLYQSNRTLAQPVSASTESMYMAKSPPYNTFSASTFLSNEKGTEPSLLDPFASCNTVSQPEELDGLEKHIVVDYSSATRDARSDSETSLGGLPESLGLATIAPRASCRKDQISESDRLQSHKSSTSDKSSSKSVHTTTQNIVGRLYSGTPPLKSLARMGSSSRWLSWLSSTNSGKLSHRNGSSSDSSSKESMHSRTASSLPITNHKRSKTSPISLHQQPITTDSSINGSDRIKCDKIFGIPKRHQFRAPNQADDTFGGRSSTPSYSDDCAFQRSDRTNVVHPIPVHAAASISPLLLTRVLGSSKTGMSSPLLFPDNDSPAPARARHRTVSANFYNKRNDPGGLSVETGSSPLKPRKQTLLSLHHRPQSASPSSQNRQFPFNRQRSHLYSPVIETTSIAAKGLKTRTKFLGPDGLPELCEAQVNQYNILGTIGRGSFGRVMKCRSDETGVLYACKIVSKTRLRRKFRWSQSGFPARSPETSLESVSAPPFVASAPADKHLAAIKCEIAILKKLSRHQNINALVEVLDDAGHDNLYMIFELCTGPIMKLDGIDPVCPLSEDVAWRYFRDILCGLEFLHYNHIVHRDIKPENLLLRADGHVQIADFGISLMFGVDNEISESGETSPLFSAPEFCAEAQEMNDSDRLESGKAADIWSLGVTLYALIHGYCPFRHQSPILLYRMISTEEPVFAEHVSNSLIDLLKAMLAKEPSNRAKLPEVKLHPWVTKDEQHCLPSEEQNCFAEEISAEDLDNAFQPVTLFKELWKRITAKSQNHPSNQESNSRRTSPQGISLWKSGVLGMKKAKGSASVDHLNLGVQRLRTHPAADRSASTNHLF